MSTGSGPAARPASATPGFIVAGVIIACAVAAIPLLRAERADLRTEVAWLRTQKATAAQRLDSLKATTAVAHATLALETARAVSREEPKLHLVVAVDSGTVALMRDGITLRTMPARFTGGRPTRGTQSITRIAETVVKADAATVDSLGNTVKASAPETKVERVTLSDGTTIEGGDAAAALLGGVDAAPGPRMIIVSRRDFAAIRPNLVRGMKAVLF
jgi:hypothetical protein